MNSYFPNFFLSWFCSAHTIKCNKSGFSCYTLLSISFSICLCVFGNELERTFSTTKAYFDHHTTYVSQSPRSLIFQERCLFQVGIDSPTAVLLLVIKLFGVRKQQSVCKIFNKTVHVRKLCSSLILR